MIPQTQQWAEGGPGEITTRSRDGSNLSRSGTGALHGPRYCKVNPPIMA